MTTAINPREIDETLAALDTEMARNLHQAARAIDTLHSAAGDRRRYTSRNCFTWGRDDADVITEVRSLLVDAGDYTVMGGLYGKAVRKAMADYDTGTAEAARLEAEMARVEAPYHAAPWSRFFKLMSTKNAKIHDSRLCGALHRSDFTDMGWHPELSGLGKDEAVEQLGSALCSRCFKKAAHAR
ncbi:hypothetical protein ACFFMN_23280 [Planobispora siamensis]|uniref:Uncharacterized protein n=1 Tax=Planobispora siamensis TaxID=936338 RepID=A0A8J3WN19_9ACTN|nr:hypothetical protein [Planobispora siamensis]GIH95285.1 hypothetical protein Psi01_59150 [Planobispora siamensis]